MKLQFNPSTGKLSYNTTTEKVQMATETGPGIPGVCSACWEADYTPQAMKATITGARNYSDDELSPINGEYTLGQYRCDGENEDEPSTAYGDPTTFPVSTHLEINRGGLGGPPLYDDPFFFFILRVDGLDEFVGDSFGVYTTLEEVCEGFKNDAIPNEGGANTYGGTVTFEEVYV